MKRVIISGGGTGGHIFPALSIAGEIQRRYPECDLLFVGAEGRMEAERIPAAGYSIRLLPVQGLERGGGLFSKIRTMKHLLRSIEIARSYLADFHPEVVVGVGGYASAPTLLAASKSGIPILVQEQNSYAGKTNRLVGRRAETVCVAYPNMERYFPKAKKIVLTGNPVRAALTEVPKHDPEAYSELGLDPTKKTLLVLGGSLGARSINDSVIHSLPRLAEEKEVQVLWQCGKGYYDEAKQLSLPANVHLRDFVSRMDLAYATADLVVSRAGAGSISELTLLGMPTILVPSPNVAEDHQTKNAQALASKEAAVLIKDSDSVEQLIGTALELIHNDSELATMSQNALTMALPNAAEHIVDELELLL